MTDDQTTWIVEDPSNPDGATVVRGHLLVCSITGQLVFTPDDEWPEVLQ